jgi:hypothetical protein
MITQDKITQDESRQENQRNRPRLSHLHPVLYWTIIGLVVWFAVSAWTFFGAEGYMDLLLVVVTGFLFMTIAILSAIS